MDDFFKSLLKGNTDNPEPVFTEKLFEICPDAISVEWFFNGTTHEAIFSERGQEKIARFSLKAQLIDLKSNLGIEEIPVQIRTRIEKQGEIMSSVLIQEGKNYSYEFVLRDKTMKREIIFTDKEGNILYRQDFHEII